MKKILFLLYIILILFTQIPFIYAEQFCSEDKNICINILETENQNYIASVNGKKENEYKKIENITFSPNSKRYAYQATKNNGSSVMVIDGKEEKEYINIYKIKFSPNSEFYAYPAQKDKHIWTMVINGKEGKEYGNCNSSNKEKDCSRYCGDAKEYTNGNITGFYCSGKVKIYTDSKKIVPIINGDYIFFTPDSKNYAYIVENPNPTTGKSMLIINGVESKEYSYIYGLSYSPDNKTYIYIATKEDGKQVAVVNGVEEKEYKNISDIKFTPDSKFYFYKADSYYIVNGGEGNIIWIFGEFLTIKDEKNYAFSFKKNNGNSVMVVNGIEENEYKAIDGLITYSIDNKNYAYRAQKANGKWTMVINGKEGKEYPEIGQFIVFLNANTYAYIVKIDNNNQTMVINGAEGKRYYRIGNFQFSPDNKNYAYIVMSKNGDQYMVINGKEEKKYKKIESITFSPNSKIYAYETLKSNGNRTMIINGKEEKEYKEISKIKFSQNSKDYAYSAKKENGNWIMVTNGKEGKEYDSLLNEGRIYYSLDLDYGTSSERENYPIEFYFDYSPNSEILAYPARKENGNWIMNINGIEGKEYSSVSRIYFSNDSKNYAYLVVKDNGKYALIVNGVESEEYYYISNTIIFSENNKSYTYKAQKDRLSQTILIEEEIKTPNNIPPLNPTTKFNTSNTNNETITINSKIQSRKDLAISKRDLNQTKNGESYQKATDKIVKSLSDQNLIKYYNTFQTIDLNSQKYKNIKELINYTKVRISNEIHQRDSIEKNIIQ